MIVATSNNAQAKALIVRWRERAKFLMKMPVSKSNHLDVMAARHEAEVLRKCATQLRKLVDRL